MYEQNVSSVIYNICISRFTRALRYRHCQAPNRSKPRGIYSIVDYAPVFEVTIPAINHYSWLSNWYIALAKSRNYREYHRFKFSNAKIQNKPKIPHCRRFWTHHNIHKILRWSLFLGIRSFLKRFVVRKNPNDRNFKTERINPPYFANMVNTSKHWPYLWPMLSPWSLPNKSMRCHSAVR